MHQYRFLCLSAEKFGLSGVFAFAYRREWRHECSPAQPQIRAIVMRQHIFSCGRNSAMKRAAMPTGSAVVAYSRRHSDRIAPSLRPLCVAI